MCHALALPCDLDFLDPYARGQRPTHGASAVSVRRARDLAPGVAKLQRLLAEEQLDLAILDRRGAETHGLGTGEGKGAT